ncbi:DNA repair protein RecO [Thermovibrio sp.]
METKGIVLKSLRLGEGLRALSLYTELLGRVNAIVKVKRGEFPIKYEPFSITHFEIVEKGERFEVKKGKLIKENFPKSWEELLYKSQIVKPVISSQFPSSKKLFKLIEYYLSIKEEFPLARVMFLSKLLFIEGLFPEVKRCVSCKSPQIAAFSPKRGGVVCKRCRKEGDISWSRSESGELLKLTKKPFEEVKRSYERELLPKLETALKAHLREL